VSDLLNLIVELRSEQFGAEARTQALRELERTGARVEWPGKPSERFCAWIDEAFGGFWSSESLAGKNVVATVDSRYAGFATYDVRGLRYPWLRGCGAQPDVGIFGPFGVARGFRGSQIGPALLQLALAGLREAGYERALVPAVGDDRLVRYYERESGARIVERFTREQLFGSRSRAVVLASGNGSNFQSVIDGVKRGSLPLEIALVVCNNVRAFVLERAAKADVRSLALPWQRSAQSRTQYDAELLAVVQNEVPDLVLLLGWMHLLDERFVQRFPHILNIHPAFLPLDESSDEVTFPDGSVAKAFRGARAVRDALACGSSWVGASVHRVTAQTDRGPILARAPLRVHEGETEDEVFERLHPLEHRVLTAAIQRWAYEFAAD